MPKSPLLVPDEVELIEFFGSEPQLAEPQNGFWLYETRDASGVTLRFSFDVLQCSVQTSIELGDVSVETVSHECATCIRKDGASNELVVEFEDAGSRTELRVSIEDRIRCTWATLATR